MRKVLILLIVILILLTGGVLFYKYQISQNPNQTFSLFNLGSKTNKETKSQEDEKPKFINLGPAPEFDGITKWFNTEPQTIDSLKGKVVMINFWTYSCIGCIHTIPQIQKWMEQYKDQGLTVIGVHTPEYTFEKVTSNLEAAIKRYSVTYPIAQDNNYKTWSAYNNQFWPAIYLVDKNGNIVYTHFGDGDFKKTETAIRSLLGLEGDIQIPQAQEIIKPETPEIHLGSAQINNFGGQETISEDEQIYGFPKKLAKNKFALEGKWKIEPEAAVHTQGFGRIRSNFTASKAFIVAESTDPVTLKIYVDGKLQKGVTIYGSDLYSLFESQSPSTHTMEIEFPQGGVRVFSLTFE